MPAINLRLSEEEHRALVGSAARSGRSLQRQIVFMLFGARAAGELGAGEPGAAGRSRSVSAVAVETEPDQASLVAPVVAGEQSASPAPSSPEKKCSRAARHHINHSGKPCAECGGW